MSLEELEMKHINEVLKYFTCTKDVNMDGIQYWSEGKFLLNVDDRELMRGFEEDFENKVIKFFNKDGIKKEVKVSHMDSYPDGTSSYIIKIK